MDRQEAIAYIEKTFPADSSFDHVAQVGAQLLRQAKDRHTDWRQEPTSVLVRYAELCAVFEAQEQGAPITAQAPDSRRVFWFSRV